MTNSTSKFPVVRRATLDFCLVLDDPLVIRSLKEAMTPEFEVASHERCTLIVGKARGRRDLRSLCLQFSAKDLTSLRASMNVNLRLVSAGLKTLKAARNVDHRNAE